MAKAMAGRGHSGASGDQKFSDTKSRVNQEPLAPGDSLWDSVFPDFPGARSVLEFLVRSLVCKGKKDQ